MPRFLFPPHPHSSFKIRPPYMDDGKALQRLEDEGGWVAQRKYNGSHAVIWLHQGDMALWNRQGEPFTTYTLTGDMQRCFKSLDVGDTEVVLDGELLHTKAKSKITGKQAASHTIVVYDLLYFGKYLLTETFPQRYDLLSKICRHPTALEPKKRGFSVSNDGHSSLWLAETFASGFVDAFYWFFEFDGIGPGNDGKGNDKFPEIEGLVCKRTSRRSALTFGNKAYDVDWMMRVRKTKENMYMF